MANVQTRRTISINRALHELASTTADRLGVSLSQFTELALRKHIEGEGVPIKPTVSMAFANALDRIASITRETIIAVSIKSHTAMPIVEQDAIADRYARRFMESMARMFAELAAGIIE